ncbi:UNVERIFIED_CONTAM: hypothetical protein Slati_3114100 [Sesamum latifolium]|uniref:Uncharacterized protein n=1 Tax=Sesamum latifolium TaxID=2727402 RepID=A0AAW2UV99_9LAMI
MGQAYGLGGLFPSWALPSGSPLSIHAKEGPQGPGGLGFWSICVGASFVLSGPESVGPSFSPPHSKEGDPRLLLRVEPGDLRGEERLLVRGVFQLLFSSLFPPYKMASSSLHGKDG